MRYTKSRGPNTVDTEVGRRVRMLRIERGLSQDSMGEHIGVSFQQIQKYEKGTNRLSVGRLSAVAKLLKTTPHDLMGWDSKTNVIPIDIKTYQLARDFLKLRDEWKGPVRLLINAMMRVQ
jgi:transcriptional regulator with XRE-family HTH domain